MVLLLMAIFIIAHSKRKRKCFSAKILQSNVKNMSTLRKFVKVDSNDTAGINRQKRDGKRFSADEINAFRIWRLRRRWADYQTSALIMACYINGLDADEQTALTEAMLNSGDVLIFPTLTLRLPTSIRPAAVGDKTSMIIAPLVAACVVAVPMISGRGLGHTGGTLDKLESIKGYNVNLSIAEFRKIIKQCGFAMTGQTAEIAPADRKSTRCGTRRRPLRIFLYRRFDYVEKTRRRFRRARFGRENR
jgi:hypothetical protein